jgi:CHAT domain-containing protein/Tfp pilus assembly protein PilF
MILLIFTITPDITAADGETVSHPDSVSKKIKELRREGKFIEALEVAHGLVVILKSDPEAAPWEVADAERLATTLEFINGLSEDKQKKLIEANRLSVGVTNFWTAGEYKKGGELAERVLAIRSPIFGEQHVETARSLSNVAAFLIKQDRYSEAEPLCKKVLTIRERILGLEHPKVTEILNYLSVLYMEQGRYAEAEPIMKQMLTIREKILGLDHPLVASCLNNLGNFYRIQGRYSEAEPCYKRALTIGRKVLEPEHRHQPHFLSNLGALYEDQGLYVKAEPLIKSALALREKTLGPEHPDVAISCNTLGVLHMNQGNYAKAEQYFKRSLAIMEKAEGVERSTVVRSLHSLAFIYTKLPHKHAEAEPILEKALQISEEVYGPEHNIVSLILNSLADYYQSKDEFTKAESLYEQALEINQKILGYEHHYVAANLHGLANILRNQGEHANAEAFYEQAIYIYGQVLGRDHLSVAETLQDLAVCLLQQGKQAAASSKLSDAADIFETARLRAGSGFARSTFQTSPYSLLAATSLESGNSDEAWPAAERALGRSLADLLVASGQRRISPSEIAREDSLKEALHHLESELAVLQKTIQADSTGEAVKRFNETRFRLLKVEAAWSTFQQKIAAKYPVTEGQAYTLEQIQESLTQSTAIIGWLHEEMYPRKFASWGYVIRKSGPVNWIRLDTTSNEADIQSSVTKVRDFHQALHMAASWQERVMEVDELNSYATKVWTQWVAPIYEHLDGIDNLVIIPSKPVLGIPIEALVDSEGRYLDERYAVSYAPSATVYAWLREFEEGGRETGARKALLLGDPPFTLDHARAMEREEEREESADEFAIIEAKPLFEMSVVRGALEGDGTALTGLPRLPWTRKEVKQVISAIPKAATLLGPRASEQEIVRLAESAELREFDTIHLATHALVDDEQPERSALILSQVNLPDPIEAVMAGERIYDGKLTVNEIIREWDLSADLVTLSACQSGLGREVAGEGYIGLAYAFLQSGARSLLVSLWKVEDEATCLLMGRFYGNLTGNYQDKNGSRGGKPMRKAEALQEAKHWLRTFTDKNGQQIFQHPVYWSAFVLIGDASF